MGGAVEETEASFADIAGVRTYVESRGSGRAVLFVHDRFGTHDTWLRQVGPLSQGLRTISYDARDLGRTGRSGAPYGVDDLADDVVAVLDHLSVASAVLVGLSMGGGVAQTCALRHPDRVDGLVLVSSSSEFSATTRARFLREAELADGGGLAAAFPAMLERWYSADFRERHPDVLARALRDLEALDPAVAAARSRANATRDLTSSLSLIECPVLFVGGELDPMGSRAHSEVFAALLGDRLTVAMVPDSSHMVPVEAADTLNELIADFVTRL